MDDRVYFPVSRGGGGCMRISQAIHLFINDREKKKEKKKKQTCKRGKGKARDTRVFCNQIDHPLPDISCFNSFIRPGFPEYETVVPAV